MICKINQTVVGDFPIEHDFSKKPLSGTYLYLVDSDQDQAVNELPNHHVGWIEVEWCRRCGAIRIAPHALADIES